MKPLKEQAGWNCPTCGTWYAVNTLNDGLCGDMSLGQPWPGCQGILQPEIWTVWSKGGRRGQLGTKETRSMAVTTRVAPVQFYKDGDTMGVRTTLTDSPDFLNQCAERLAQMIEDGLYAHDWEFQLQGWLPQIVEIACKLKGYKADVREDRLITAGYFDPPQDALITPAEKAVDETLREA